MFLRSFVLKDGRDFERTATPVGIDRGALDEQHFTAPGNAHGCRDIRGRREPDAHLVVHLPGEACAFSE